MGCNRSHQCSAKSRLMFALTSNLVEVRHTFLILKTCTFFRSKSRSILISSTRLARAAPGHISTVRLHLRPMRKMPPKDTTSTSWLAVLCRIVVSWLFCMHLSSHDVNSRKLSGQGGNRDCGFKTAVSDISVRNYNQSAGHAV